MSPARSAARPWVSINAAVTLDGKIATPDRRRFDLSSREDRRRMAALRDAAQAVIVGAGTLRAEDPPPYIREQKHPRPASDPAFTWVVLTRTLDLPSDGRVLRSDEVAKIVVAPEHAPVARADLERRAEVWRLGREEVDLAALLDRLAQRGARRVVVEGGGEVNFAFLKAGLVDEVYVTVCPFILGGAGAPTLAGGPGLGAGGPLPLELVEVERRGGEIFLHYRCRRSA